MDSYGFTTIKEKKNLLDKLKKSMFDDVEIQFKFSMFVANSEYKWKL